MQRTGAEVEVKKSFFKLSVSTLIAVYLLILVGGIVRSTGSGMGCPDWPKCFGSWVPPTSVEELPGNYKEIYSSNRDSKNQRFARYLKVLGFEETASGILTDKSIRNESDFNAVKTWIEYINRLVGVIIGFLIFAVFVASLRYRKSKRNLTLTALVCFLLVGFQGWIGSVVVSTNLTPWTITLHMFLALIIVALLIYIVHLSKIRSNWSSRPPYIFWWLLACIIVLLIQILFGTNVREAIDRVAAILPRRAWISNIGLDFILHRSFSWVVLFLHAGLVANLFYVKELRKVRVVLLTLIASTFLSGIGMAYNSMPAWMQPVHLVMAAVTFGMLVFLFLQAKDNKSVTVTAS